MLNFTLVIVGFFAVYSLSRLLMRHRVDLAILLSPPLLLGLWTLAIVAVVNGGVPLSDAWQPFWGVIAIATVAGALLSVRDKAAADLWVLFLPIATAAVVMTPYLIHGIGSFPGSWFWDGFAYMALGESLWLHPRWESAAGLELFYQFGHACLRGRYISSSVIAMMKGIYPLGRDAQAAMGYFLFLCIFTFSSSCYFLAKVTMPNRRHLQIVFVVVASVSGPLLNLVWANNFDHLLSMSIAPAILGLAYILRWGSISDAVLFGLLVAAEVYIYPEMAALFVMTAGLILVVRLYREREPREQLVSATIAAITAVVLIVPGWPDLSGFFVAQINAAGSATPAAARPGNGYFPTFFSVVCGPAAWFGMFRPYAQCEPGLTHYAKLAVSLGCWTVLAGALLTWRRNAALVIAAGITVAGAAFFLFVQRYDYGAFKILETGWVPLLLLATLSIIDSGLTAKRAAASIAAALVIVSVTQVAAFERWVPAKSIDKFAELQQAIPLDGGVEVKIGDALAFQWATYYLRHHRAAFTEGQLMYYPASDAEPANLDQDLKYLLTDKPRNAKAVWTNGTFYLYAGPARLDSRCDVIFGKGWHAPEGVGADWLRWSSGNGALRFRSRDAGEFLLTGEILSLTRPNALDVTVKGGVQTRVEVRDLDWAFHAFAPLRFSLDGGNDTIVHLVSRAPAMTHAHDPRPLAIAVRHLSLRRADGVECDVRR